MADVVVVVGGGGSLQSHDVIDDLSPFWNNTTGKGTSSDIHVIPRFQFTITGPVLASVTTHARLTDSSRVMMCTSFWW